MSTAESQTASLTKVDPASGDGETLRVPFTFNPERRSTSQSYTTGGATGTGRDEMIKNLGFIEIRMDKVFLVGEDTKKYADTLLSWSCPAPGTVTTAGDQKEAQPVALRFSWGVGLTYDVNLRSVTITYTRFVAGTGLPIRADVHLELYASVGTV